MKIYKKYIFLFLVLSYVSLAQINPVHAAYTGETRTWSETDIRNIVREELKGNDAESVKKVIKDESAAFEEKLENKVNQQQNNFIEIIGLFAAVLALITVNINIIKSADTFGKALGLITAQTISLALFALLIHLFFR